MTDLKGVQQPRLSNFPPFFTTLADDVVDLAMVAGLDLLPWEELILRHSLGTREDAKWAASQVLLIVCRQNGKNIVVEARELGGLFLLGERKILHTAHEFKTAKDAFTSLTGRIDNVPDLREMCQLPHRTSNEEVSIRTTDGRYCRFIARNKNSGRGFREIDLLICDEAYAVTDDITAALKPTQAAARNPQIWYTSSAGMGDSEVLARIRGNGIAKTSRRLLFAEWSAEEGSNLEDREQWAAANPSLGYFLDWEFLEEQFETLGPVQFAREHMGLWDDPRIADVIPADAWKACEEPGSLIASPIAAAVRVSPDRTRSSIAVCGRTIDGWPQVEVIESGHGTNWVVGKVQALMGSSSPPIAVAADASGATASLIPALKEVGIDAMPLAARDVVAGCGAFYDAVMAGEFRHRGDKTLKVALSGARKRPIGSGGGWGWGARDLMVDITGLEACTDAMHALAVNSALAEPVRSGKVW